MPHEPGNSHTVYVVMSNDNKDLSDARRFGALRAVFLNPRKPYDTDKLVATARAALSQWQRGDYLLMIGDPVLCGVCMAVLAESHGAVSTLSWDRLHIQYTAQTWEFDGHAGMPDYSED